MNKKLITVASLALTVALLTTACFAGGSPEKPSTGGTTTESTDGGSTSTGDKILRTNNTSEPGSLDPALAQGTHESWVIDHTFEGLMKKDKDGNLVGGMAKDYTLADDGVTYTFNMRDDIKWSNGDPVTANDFEFSWKRVLDANLGSTYAYQLYYLKNGEAYNTGTASIDDVGVKALDDLTLEVVLEQPAPYFVELTAFYTFFPVNKAVVEANPEWANEPATFVSNGAFKLTQWNHKANILIMKNDNYYNASEVKLDGIDFAILEDENTAWQKYQANEFDFLYPLPQTVVADLKAKADPELVIGEELAVYYYNFNTKIKPFNNPKVRQALSMAIDRETITDKVAQGGQTPAFAIVPPGIPDETGKDFREAQGDYFKEDVEAAKVLLAEGLAEEGMTVADIKPAILYNTQEGHKKVAQVVQEMWRNNLGIEVQLENVEFQVKLDREKAGDYQVSRAGWVGDYVDPMTFIDLFVSDGPYNDSKFNMKEYDELVSVAKGTADQTVRFDAMREAEALFMNNASVMPIYYYTKPYTQKTHLTGVYKIVNRDPSFIYSDMNK
ncbi:MAG TPA: peptide ABC transporter substrate-binding protein [Epulopiscium sp.]|nr:peptide ABC transporter substrate-binding protein [Candidatus Epulonipiscium sp.]